MGGREVERLTAQVVRGPVSEGEVPRHRTPSVSAHVTGWKLSVAWPVTTPPGGGTQAPTRLRISLMAPTLTLSPLPGLH